MDNGEAYKYATDQIVEYAREKEIDLVVGPEARGFIIGCPVRIHLELALPLFVKKESFHVKPLR